MVGGAGTDISGAPFMRRITVGAFEVTTVTDGTVSREGVHPTFGADQPAEAVADLLEQNFLPPDRYVHAFTPTLIQAGTDLILFDTGFGPGGRTQGLGRLRDRLLIAGYAPADISIVVLTHMHGDHISGLMEKDGPAFPEARYVMGSKEYDFWTSSDLEGTRLEQGHNLVREKVAPLAENATFIDDGDDVVPGITAVAAYGHTPGHLAFNVESDGARLMLTADTANHYVASLQRPDWHVSYDHDKDEAARTRHAIFGMIADERIPFIGHHMPPPAIGYVSRTGEGFHYMPMTYQFGF